MWVGLSGWEWGGGEAEGMLPSPSKIIGSGLPPPPTPLALPAPMRFFSYVVLNITVQHYQRPQRLQRISVFKN